LINERRKEEMKRNKNYEKRTKIAKNDKMKTKKKIR